MSELLQEIIEHKRSEIETLKTKYKDIQVKIETGHCFKEIFTTGGPVRIIAEIKPASPSEGMIFEPTEENIKNIARIYSRYPVGAISVLTDEKYFHGSYENIALVKELTDKPVLCKDFIIDTFQIDLAKHFKADAILLIAEALDKEKAVTLYKYAKKINLDVLFEFHSPDSLNFLLENNVDIIGINNRDLNSMKVDINKCLSLRSSIPEDIILIAESGFASPKQIKMLEEKKINGALIGTSILKSEDIEKKLKEFVYYYE